VLTVCGGLLPTKMSLYERKYKLHDLYTVCYVIIIIYSVIGKQFILAASRNGPKDCRQNKHQFYVGYEEKKLRQWSRSIIRDNETKYYTTHTAKRRRRKKEELGAVLSETDIVSHVLNSLRITFINLNYLLLVLD
jgi:hypothetical protein